MFTKPTHYNNQCIIQWYADSVASGNHQRDQRFFQSSNNGNHSITQGGLEISHTELFRPKCDGNARHTLFSPNSYQLSKNTFLIKKITPGTTDIFLYGHSTYRDYAPLKGLDRRPESVRGISVDGHYISAAKIAKFLDNAGGILKEKHCRIWLLSCHTSLNDIHESYAMHLARKLNGLGWKNKRLIGFEKEVTTTTLEISRRLASETFLYRPLNWSQLHRWKPHLITIDQFDGIIDEQKF